MGDETFVLFLREIKMAALDEAEKEMAVGNWNGHIDGGSGRAVTFVRDGDERERKQKSDA